MTATIKITMLYAIGNAQCKIKQMQNNGVAFMMIDRKFLPTRVRCKANVQFSGISAITPIAVKVLSVK